MKCSAQKVANYTSHSMGKSTKSAPRCQCILRQSGILAPMHFIYNLGITIVQWLLPLTTFFSAKMRLFVAGRKIPFDLLQSKLNAGIPTIWFHAASLGEYEQGVPVMEQIIKRYPHHQLLLTFFSPSGFEIKKNNALAKATIYLPLDTPSNVKRFLDLVQPEIVFFIKYEFWPNYLTALKQRNIRTFLLSGVFRKSQSFFKPYGRWMINSLGAFEHFFLQDQPSSDALRELGFKNQAVSGDTRFDRVAQQIEMDNTLDFMERFVENSLCVVCGSTWPEGDLMLASFINTREGVAKFVLAPHEINPDKIAGFQKRLRVPSVLYSEKEEKDIKEFDVLILDTIGLLSKVYSYADVAYVGGAAGGTGLHNILEPATFGVPILTGANIGKFPEAVRLRQLAGLFAVNGPKEFTNTLSKLLLDKKFRTQTGMIAGHFVNSNTGATASVMEYLANNNGATS